MAGAATANPTRRDLLVHRHRRGRARSALGAVAWPLIDQMNPDASTLALATTEVDISAIPEGQIVTVKWRGKPVFIRHRTQKEIDEAAEHVRSSDLPDPQTDAERVQEARMAGRRRRLHASRLRAARP